MKIGVVLNGISRDKDLFYNKYLPPLLRQHEVDVFETRTENDAILISQTLARNSCPMIIAAGGDGTVNQVVNGLLCGSPSDSIRTALCILPLGSGNDFVRTIRLNKSVDALLSRIAVGKITAVDVGEIRFAVSPAADGATSKQSVRYFVNVADVGMGPAVVRGVLESGRAFGSAVAYYKSIIKTFFTYQPVMLEASGDGWTWTKEIRTFAIGNGKYLGNGLCIAPGARMDDGVFDIFAVGPVSVIDFIIQSIPMKNSKKVVHREVSYFRSSQVTLTSPSPVEIEADGEIIGWLPATIRFSAQKLPLLID